MDLTRRETIGLGAAAAAAAFLPLPAFAESNGYEEIVKAFTGGAEVKDGAVEISAPEIAENGNTVPVGVSAAGATSIVLISTGNPNPEIAKFTFGPLSGSSQASTRIRMAKTQDLLAIAKMEDGSFIQGKAAVKVTIGGCGG